VKLVDWFVNIKGVGIMIVAYIVLLLFLNLIIWGVSFILETRNEEEPFDKNNDQKAEE
jgi:hypothetical protein